MMKMNALLAAVLFAFASAAHAQTSGQTAQPNATGAASVEKAETANKSGGKADKGLDTAEKNIAKPKPVKSKDKKASKERGTVEKAEHAEKAERPAR